MESRPLINLDELELSEQERGELYRERYGPISDKIGARKLGYSLSIVPPGKRICPYHNHHVQEEMFLVLEGTGTLRFGGREYPLRANDVIACPPGGREVAHQIINTGSTDLKVFCLSTTERPDVCEYPDSDKVGVFGEFRKLFKAEHAVDYWEGEPT